MIPLRDTIRSRSIPIVNYLLIATCGFVFLFELSMGERAEHFILQFGAIPSQVVGIHGGFGLSFNAIVPLFTSMFIHGGLMHLLGNMLFLYIFGDNVEDRIGHIGYLIFYLLAGIGAVLVEVYVHPVSSAPIIGASGAIAGVMGAYFLLYPRARVLTLIPLFVFFPVVEIPAFFFLGFWFVLQFVQGGLSYASSSGGGIAWWAHAGGFVVGAVLLGVFLLIRRR